ncbi:hypothetical protein KHA93_01905 [Bacillus sp. FJAT-49732]|uniref:Glucosamine inositolphosphorylceramide transferase 1 N-terminal domain-containing protein n=1 Tax=Lederbergia citrisecunda TaxID=2833583 RepID=A0A942TIT3_9BACI|nr:hypothetical protein [Lederbergia citrisecunda]MBS4198415.1 hypothetical protein [Lederbergia citrisecunda]
MKFSEMKGGYMYLIYISSIILLPLMILLFRKKLIVGVWSISVFNSPSIISKKTKGNSMLPSLQASDVSDVYAEFVADPFIINHNSVFYMFFEILDKSTDKGIIGLATSRDGKDWSYERTVLKETYHLSYPYVFKYKDNFYMIPETCETNKVLLYKAKRFPYEWEIVSEMIQGNYVDASIFYYKNKWWIMAGKSGKLHLFYSDNLYTNWIEHVKSPLIENNYNITRPGGRVIVEKNNIFRYTQDGEPNYGSAVRVFKITHLSEREYEEEELSVVLNGSKMKADWKKDGMHSIDQYKISDNNWLVAVDGHNLVNKNYFLWKVDRILAKFLTFIKEKRSNKRYIEKNRTKTSIT